MAPTEASNSAYVIPAPIDFINRPAEWWSKSTLYGSADTLAPAPLHDVEAFRKLAAVLAQQAVACTNANRFDDVAKLQFLLEWAEQHCQQEPLATAYDRCLANFGLLTAYGALSHLQHEQVYQQVALLYDLLKEGRQRRASHGDHSEPGREMRLRCLSLLAEAKWLDSPQARDRVLTPRQIVDEYSAIAANIDEYLSELTFEEHELPMVLQDHGWSSLAVLKVALRYMPGPEWETALRLFNEAHQTSLDLEVPTDVPTLHDSGVKLIWRLEWETAKLASLGPLDHKLLRQLHDMRIATAKATHLGVNYIDGSQREYAAVSKISWRQSLWSLAENGKLSLEGI